jgi:branched-chain amino acid transport system permease protein
MLAYLLQFSFVGITEGCIYALIGLGIVCIHRTTEVMYFAQGNLAMVSGVTLYAFSAFSHLPLVITVPLSIVVGVIVGMGSQWLLVQPLLDRGAKPISVSISTISVALVLEVAAMISFGKLPLAAPPFSGDKPIVFLGASIVPQELWVVGSTTICLILAFLFFKGTWTGKAMAGLGEHAMLAKALGFPVRELFSYSFILAALFGGIAGVVSAPISYTGYFVGTRLTIKGFIGATLGGINNPQGAVLGGVMLGLFEAFASGLISSGFKDFISILLLLLILLWRPKGLLGED